LNDKAFQGMSPQQFWMVKASPGHEPSTIEQQGVSGHKPSTVE